MNATWPFFATSHGKTKNDGVGATVQRETTKESLRSPCESAARVGPPATAAPLSALGPAAAAAAAALAPDRERLALDISALKQQYARLRERQRQAHIILSVVVSLSKQIVRRPRAAPRPGAALRPGAPPPRPPPSPDRERPRARHLRSKQQYAAPEKASEATCILSDSHNI
ncbi:Uncharacterized protein GBIM_12249 [Gryllus bimaculatus]|nr:Uncharacterized protein GBIM_12249 [Gryllus bimaculatus]